MQYTIYSLDGLLNLRRHSPFEEASFNDTGLDIAGAPPSVFLSPTDPTSRNPYVQQRNISIQRELARDFLTEIGSMDRTD
jgi:hypothetical protein